MAPVRGPHSARGTRRPGRETEAQTEPSANKRSRLFSLLLSSLGSLNSHFGLKRGPGSAEKERERTFIGRGLRDRLLK